jgi:IS6 family transposase
VGAAVYPLLAEAARRCRHRIGDRWQVDETYVRVAGRWRYVYRTVDQSGQVIDVFVSARRDAKAAHRFFGRAIGTTAIIPIEVVTDQAAPYPAVLGRAAPGDLALHRAVRQQSRRGGPRPPQSAAASDARIPAGPQRQGRDRRARLCAEHPPGTRRTAVEAPVTLRLAVAFDELALAI